jgi:hypothetical protein
MPRLSIRTVMLEELATHHCSTQQQRFQQHISEVLSDLSLTDQSDLSLLHLVPQFQLTHPMSSFPPIYQSTPHQITTQHRLP